MAEAAIVCVARISLHLRKPEQEPWLQWRRRTWNQSENATEANWVEQNGR